MRVFIDTNVFDWIVDDPDGPRLHALLQGLTSQCVVCPEVARELHAIPDSKAPRRELLLTVLASFQPLSPTRVPVMGLARVGAAIQAPPDAIHRRAELVALGLRKLDVIHLLNAHYHQCQVFLTSDREDILKRRDTLEELLSLRPVRPAEFIADAG